MGTIIKCAIARVFHPPPSQRVLDAQEQSRRVVEASQNFGDRQDVFGRMVRNVRARDLRPTPGN